MDEPLARDCLRSLTDDELITLLRAWHCEMFIARTGQFSLWIASRKPHAPLPATLIREAFRRRARLLPFTRVNGIRLRGLGKLAEAA